MEELLKRGNREPLLAVKSSLQFHKDSDEYQGTLQNYGSERCVYYPQSPVIPTNEPVMQGVNDIHEDETEY